MRKTINKETISGRLYDISQLALKKVENQASERYGQEYIGGSIDIATDDNCLNIVTVYFTFVQATYSSGKVNNSYTVLKNLLTNGKTVLVDGADKATLVKVDAALGLNDFYTTRNNEEILVSAKRNNGSFINIVNKLDDPDNRSTFQCDMLINKVTRVEANEENNITEDYVIVRGGVFDFRGAILPVEFIVRSKGGMNYFESLNVDKTHLVFTKVWGVINSKTIVDRREEESAFGEPVIKEYTKTVREWLITGTSKPESVYEIGDEETGITKEEIDKALADRQVYLADVKKRADDYQAAKNAAKAPVAPAVANIGDFGF